MKKRLKNNRFNRFLFIFLTTFCSTLTLQTSQNNEITVNFDSLFPVTWYQKGLQAAIYVWHVLADACKGNPVTVDLPNNVLSKLALVQFSVGRMVKDRVCCLSEDKAYFGAVLNKIKELVGCVKFDDDFVMCVDEMVSGIEGELLQTP